MRHERKTENDSGLEQMGDRGAFGDGEDMGGGIRAIGLSSDKNIVRCAEDPRELAFQMFWSQSANLRLMVCLVSQESSELHLSYLVTDAAQTWGVLFSLGGRGRPST